MNESETKVTEHIRSVRIWLEKAEQSFNRQADIKGELNLMLAEAEMKHLRKCRGLRRWPKAAVCMGIAVVCGGVWYALTWHSPVVSETPPVRQHIETQQHTAQPDAAAVPEPAPDRPDGPPSVPADNSYNAAEAAPPADVPSQADTVRADRETIPGEPVQHSVSAPAPVLTDAQIQEAVLDARHSLRGTAPQNT